MSTSKAIRRITRSTKKFIKLYRTAKIPFFAGALSFYTFLSIIPIVTLGVWYLASAGIAQTWINQIQSYILSRLAFSEDDKIASYFQLITDTASENSWGWIGLAVFLYTVLNLFLSIGDAIDHIIKAKAVEIDFSRGAIQTWLRRLLFLLLLPSFLVLSSSFTSWMREDSWIRHLFSFETVGPWLARPIPWTIDFTTFLLLYYYIPNSKVSLKQAARAALFVTPLFILGKWGMAQYSAYALTTQKIYGAFAVIPLVMLWVYWAWMIILCGALLIKRSPTKDFQVES